MALDDVTSTGTPCATFHYTIQSRVNLAMSAGIRT